MASHCLGLDPSYLVAGYGIIGSSLSLSLLSWTVIKTTPRSCCGGMGTNKITLHILFHQARDQLPLATPQRCLCWAESLLFLCHVSFISRRHVPGPLPAPSSSGLVSRVTDRSPRAPPHPSSCSHFPWNAWRASLDHGQVLRPEQTVSSRCVSVHRGSAPGTTAQGLSHWAPVGELLLPCPFPSLLRPPLSSSSLSPWASQHPSGSPGSHVFPFSSEWPLGSLCCLEVLEGPTS